MMDVVLAGFNIEADEIHEAEAESGRPLTPEVISAAYARITRDPRSIGAIRREARRDVEKARRSNEKIVFGLGHASIAEHAVFNFDLIGLSRLAVEGVEHFRLASFTEKSQRYIRLGKDIVVAEEIVGSGLKKRFLETARGLHTAYDTLYGMIIETGEDEWVAREDARYLLPLATCAQLGMTVNARELEYIISRLASHPLRELNTLSARLSGSAKRVAPSLIRYPEATEYFSSFESVRRGIAADFPVKIRGAAEKESVRLIHVTQDGDAKLVAGLIFSSTGVGMSQALREATRMKGEARAALVARTVENMQPHDSAWREFENVHLLFELVVSASCYAQLKRHRMATLITQPYSPSLGLSIPDSVRRARAVGFFRSSVSGAEKLYRVLLKRSAGAARYVLTNAHRRRVILGLNLRELYHFSRLRSDRHAQWEIRGLSMQMCRQAEDRLPAGACMLAGKDSFWKTKKALNT